jgi:hypothetical protein
MKKIKLVLMTLAVIIAVGGALATTRVTACSDRPQFYQAFGYFFPAGQYGEDYYCVQSSGYCTWYQPNPIGNPNWYVPCRTGFFISF